MNVNTGVFERSGGDTMSPHSFYLSLSLALLWGLIGTAVVAHQAMLAEYNPGWGSIIVLGIVVPLVGIFIATASDNGLLSFIGYNMVVIPFGFILAPTLNHYSPNVIRDAFGVTAAITAFMGALGICFPRAFKNLGAPLFFALLGLVIVRVVGLFVPAIGALTIIDYIAAGIFSLYIAYDMYRAASVPCTLDNAVDIALSLYLDVINLFLSILRIMGGSKSSD